MRSRTGIDGQKLKSPKRNTFFDLWIVVDFEVLQNLFNEQEL